MLGCGVVDDVAVVGGDDAEGEGVLVAEVGFHHGWWSFERRRKEKRGHLWLSRV